LSHPIAAAMARVVTNQEIRDRPIFDPEQPGF